MTCRCSRWRSGWSSQVRAEDTVALALWRRVPWHCSRTPVRNPARRRARPRPSLPSCWSVLAQPYALAGRAWCTAPRAPGSRLFSDHPEGVDDIVERAEMAMYRAKAGGRNGACLFDPAMQAAVAARAALEADLHDALREQQFLLMYQPQVDVDGRCIWAEAICSGGSTRGAGLVPSRWSSIPVVEETGHDRSRSTAGCWRPPAGSWSRWSKSIRGTMASVMAASPPVLCELHRRDSVVTDVRAVLAWTGAPAEQLMLEFTESMLLHDVEGTVVKMAALNMDRRALCRLIDFGTGYWSPRVPQANPAARPAGRSIASSVPRCADPRQRRGHRPQHRRARAGTRARGAGRGRGDADGARVPGETWLRRVPGLPVRAADACRCRVRRVAVSPRRRCVVDRVRSVAARQSNVPGRVSTSDAWDGDERAPYVENTRARVRDAPGAGTSCWSALARVDRRGRPSSPTSALPAATRSTRSIPHRTAQRLLRRPRRRGRSLRLVDVKRHRRPVAGACRSATTSAAWLIVDETAVSSTASWNPRHAWTCSR